MKTQTRIGTMALTLALAAAQVQAADVTLSANAWLNANGQLTNATQGVLATKTSGTGTSADPYVFDVAGNLNLGSYTILGNTANNVNQYSATWRVAGNVTGTGNFDSYTTANNTYGGNVRIEAGGSIAVNRVNARATYNQNAGSVYLWATGTVTIATYIDTRTGGGGSWSAGAVTIRSEGPVSGQGITISGSVNGDDGSAYSILTEARISPYNAGAGGAVSLYCRTNITLTAGISTRGGGASGAVLIRGDLTDGTARAATVSIGGAGGIRTDATFSSSGSAIRGGDVTIRATALQLAGGINTTAAVYQNRTGNVDIDLLENATIGGSIDTRMLYRDYPQGSPGYVKIVARRIAVLGVDGSGYSIRTWPGTLYAGRDNTYAGAVAGDADVTLTNVDTSTQLYNPASPTNSMTSSIYVTGKIGTGRWYSDNAMGNIRITAVEVQLGGELSHATLPAATGGTPTLAMRYGVTTYGVVTHLVENSVRWNGSGGHNITYTTDRGAYTYTADVPYAGKVATAVPGSIANLSVTNVTQTSALFRGYLADAGDPTSAVSVVWGEATNSLVNTNGWTAGTWLSNTYPATNITTLTASRNYYYTFVAENTAGRVLATPTEYFITGPLTPSSAGDPTCGATAADTATITITRPGTCVDGPLTVSYALSGAGTGYVSASPASGFTLAAGQTGTNIVFTPVQPNLGAPVGVTLTLLPGKYPSDALGSAAITVATAVSYNLTAASDTSIGTGMDVIEIPPDTVTVAVAGSTYTYDFWASSLNLYGKRISYAGARSVVLTNLAALTDSGAGRIDTSTAADFTVGGGVTVQSPGGIALNGTNGSGYAIDSSSTTPNAGNRYSGGDVTLVATGGVSLTAGGIRTQGRAGGRIWITDGAGGSAGNVTIAGNLDAASTANFSDRNGSVQVRGATVTIASNVVTASGYQNSPGQPITLVASGPLSVGGYLTAEQSFTSFGGSGGAVSLTGTTVTVSGSLGGLSIDTSAAFDFSSNVGGDIRVTATAGNLTLAGGVDASHPSGASRRGAVALSAPNGAITVGSLDASKVKSFTFVTGPDSIHVVQVSGVLTNFTVTESPKRFHLPAGSTLDGDIYYQAANNTTIPLTGTYDIYVDSTPTPYKLRDTSVRGTVFTFR